MVQMFQNTDIIRPISPSDTMSRRLFFFFFLDQIERHMRCHMARKSAIPSHDVFDIIYCMTFDEQSGI